MKTAEQIKNRQIAKQEEYRLRRENTYKSKQSTRSVIDNKFNSRLFDPKISPANTLNHELAKCTLVYLLRKYKLKCYGECRFVNGSRADMYIPSLSMVIEVRESESIKKLDEKIKNYPESINFIYQFTASEILEKDFVAKLYKIIKR